MSDFLTLPQSATLHLESGFTLGWVPDSSNVLTGQIQGWHSSAPMKRNKSPRLGAHGTYSERGWKDERLIIVPGAFVGSTRASAAAALDQLAGYLGDGLDGIFEVNDAAYGLRWASVYLADAGFDPKWKSNDSFTYDLHLMAPDPRKYGTTLSVPSTGIPIAGGGLQSEPLMGNSSSRINWIKNPDFEVDLSFWTAENNGVIVRDTTSPISGPASGKLTTTGAAGDVYTTAPAGAGQAWTFSVDYKTSGTVSGTPQLYIGDGVGFSYYTALPLTQTTPGRFSVTLPNTSVGTTQLIAAVFAPAVGGVVWFDNAQLEQTSSSNPYVSSVLDFGAAGSTGTATLANVGTADTGPVFTITGYVPGFTITETTTGRRLVFTDTIQAGQTLVINTDNGTVTLDGYADRRSKLTVAQWTRLGPGKAGSWLFESPGSTGANMKVEVTPAWW